MPHIHAQDTLDFPQTIGEPMSLIALDDGRLVETDTIKIETYKGALAIGLSEMVKDGRLLLQCVTRNPKPEPKLEPNEVWYEIP